MRDDIVEDDYDGKTYVMDCGCGKGVECPFVVLLDEELEDAEEECGRRVDE